MNYIAAAYSLKKCLHEGRPYERSIRYRFNAIRTREKNDENAKSG
jgi:hypothetical protein